MRKIKSLREHLIIEPGEIYNYKIEEYKVITATTEVLWTSADSINMTEKVYLLENIKTGERERISERFLKAELPKYNEVVML